MISLAQRSFAFVLVCCLLTSALPAANTGTSRFVHADTVQPANPWKIAAWDFLLPGYGAFRQDRFTSAVAYFSGNLVNLGLIYLAYRNWRFYESAYQAAYTRQLSESDPLKFEDPTGGGDYLTLQDIKNRAERGQLFFFVSIAANVILRGFSAWQTWDYAAEERFKAGPRYEFYPESGSGFRATGSYNFYF